MTLVNDVRREIAETDARLAAMSPEASLQCAALLRDTRPLMETTRQRDIADEFAREFEQRAAAKRAAAQ